LENDLLPDLWQDLCCATAAAAAALKVDMFALLLSHTLESAPFSYSHHLIQKHKIDESNKSLLLERTHTNTIDGPCMHNAAR
jgi:hypothetical protein